MPRPTTIALTSALLTAALVVLTVGLVARGRVWAATADVRFRGDVTNAMNIGRLTVRAATSQPTTSPSTPRVLAAYRDLYDGELARAEARGGLPRVDYPPGRLLVMAFWGRHVVAIDGMRGRYRDELVTPLLRLNTLAALVAAIGVGGLAWDVARRSGHGPVRAGLAALASATLLWLNPAVLLNGHGWPQWDVWVLPFVAWAAVLAGRERWLAAGAALAVGAMFKGQVLLIVPLFLAWPVGRPDPDAFGRLVAGFAAAFAACVSVWLLPTWTAWAWVAGVVIATIVWRAKSEGRMMNAKVRRSLIRRPSLLHSSFCLLTSLLVLWPWLAPSRFASILPAVVLLGVVLVLPLVWRRRRLAVALAVFALAGFLAAGRFGGSWSWLAVGFPTDRYGRMYVGLVSNLPSLMAAEWGWRVDDVVSDGGTLTIRGLLRAAAIGGVLLCGLAAGRSTTRGDPARLPWAIAAAWALLYALMPQMHERYLIWAAALSCLVAPLSVNGLLAHATLTALSALHMWHTMVASAGLRRTYPASYALVDGLHPGVGWAVLAIAVAMLGRAWANGRVRPPLPAAGGSQARECRARV